MEEKKPKRKMRRTAERAEREKLEKLEKLEKRYGLSRPSQPVRYTLLQECAGRMAHVLKERREALGLSLRAMSMHSGVSKTRVDEIEQGANNPNPWHLVAMLDVLDRIEKEREGNKRK